MKTFQSFSAAGYINFFSSVRSKEQQLSWAVGHYMSEARINRMAWRFKFCSPRRIHSPLTSRLREQSVSSSRNHQIHRACHCHLCHYLCFGIIEQIITITSNSTTSSLHHQNKYNEQQSLKPQQKARPLNLIHIFQQQQSPHLHQQSSPPSQRRRTPLRPNPHFIAPPRNHDDRSMAGYLFVRFGWTYLFRSGW